MNRPLFMVFLLHLVYADNADFVRINDFKRIERRLRMIEDTIAEERLQRREDVQNVMNKLSELQNTLNENYGTKNIVNKQHLQEELVYDKQLSWTQIVKAFASEKKINQRFRRKVQAELHKQSKACSAVAEFKTEIIAKIDSLNDYNVDALQFSERLTQYMEISTNLATKSDILTIMDSISGTITNVPKEISDIVSNTLRLAKEQSVDVGLIKTSLSYMTGELTQINRKTSEIGEICRHGRKLNSESPMKRRPNEEQPKPEFSSCVDLYDAGYTDNGVYDINVNGRVIDVYCDQTTDGGGWIVFQRRQDGSVDFNRTWREYKDGFGDLEGEFWLGNDYLSELTVECCHQLHVDIGDFRGNTAHAKYDDFRVLPEEYLYELNIGSYSGDAGNSLEYHNKRNFSTIDSDNDNSGNSCSEQFGGGWWFAGCFMAHLNGKYHVNGVRLGYEQSRLDWIDWEKRGYEGILYSLTFTEMKFK